MEERLLQPQLSFYQADSKFPESQLDREQFFHHQEILYAPVLPSAPSPRAEMVMGYQS